MKEYTLAAGGVLALALAVAGIRGLWRDQALWIGMLAFAAMTVIADMVLTAVGVFGYDAHYTLGLYFGHMPAEDLMYGIALYLVAVVAWSWEGRRGT